MPKHTRILCIAAICGLLSACIGTKGNAGGTAMTPEEQNAVAALNWLDNADAKADAKAAVTAGKTSLLSMGGRGATLPGVPTDQSAKLAEACGTDIVPGATDVVHGDTQLSYLQRAYKYAEQYNGIVLKHCTGN